MLAKVFGRWYDGKWGRSNRSAPCILLEWQQKYRQNLNELWIKLEQFVELWYNVYAKYRKREV